MPEVLQREHVGTGSARRLSIFRGISANGQPDLLEPSTETGQDRTPDVLLSSLDAPSTRRDTAVLQGEHCVVREEPKNNPGETRHRVPDYIAAARQGISLSLHHGHCISPMMTLALSSRSDKFWKSGYRNFIASINSAELPALAASSSKAAT